MKDSLSLSVRLISIQILSFCLIDTLNGIYLLIVVDVYSISREMRMARERNRPK